MSISSINNSGSLRLQNLVAQQRKGVEKQGPSLQAELQQLKNSLKSGDLAAATPDCATITSRMPTDGTTTGSEDPVEPLAHGFQDRLETSDLESAKNTDSRSLRAGTGTNSDGSSAATSTSPPRKVDLLA